MALKYALFCATYTCYDMFKPSVINNIRSTVLGQIVLALMIVNTCAAQKEEPAKTAADAHLLAAFHNIRVFPTFSGFDFVGGGLMYETGIGLHPLSGAFSARYYNGSDSVGPQVPAVPRHVRFEVQARVWPIQVFRALFVGLFVNTYSTGGVSVGGFSGYHHFISKRVSFEAAIGLQTSNATQDPEAPIFLRYHIALGLIFPKMHTYGHQTGS